MKEYHLTKIESTNIKYFTINIGLLPGYTSKGEYQYNDVVILIKKWISERLENNESSFPLKITRGSFVYGFQNNNGKIINHESAIEIHGEILKEYFSEIFGDNKALLKLVQNFASYLGQNLEQERVHVVFNSQKYILE